jgi:hypothetical protein
MGWLAQLFRRRIDRDVPQAHDFGGAIGKVPVINPPQSVCLHVFADGRIKLQERLVRLEDLEAELRSVHRPGGVVFYSRENPEEDSEVGVEVIECICRIGLPFAFPPEATPTVIREYENRGSAE